MITLSPIADLEFIPTNSSNNVPVQQLQGAIVVSHDYIDFTLQISFNPENIQASYNYDIFRNREPYFDLRGEEDEAQKDAAEKESGIVSYSKRAIDHSEFQNITRKEAEAYLVDKDIGSYLFKPSTHGPNTCFDCEVSF
jgi:hypothetical protein